MTISTRYRTYGSAKTRLSNLSTSNVFMSSSPTITKVEKTVNLHMGGDSHIRMSRMPTCKLSFATVLESRPSRLTGLAQGRPPSALQTALDLDLDHRYNHNTNRESPSSPTPFQPNCPVSSVTLN